MKRFIISISLALLLITSINGQNAADKFVFDTYSQPINVENITDYNSHDLGDIIAKKLQVIEKTFLVRFETKIALTGSDIEVQKPNLLESVEKLDKYYRKAVRKENMDRELAASKLSGYLDLAYCLFYEDSDEFEKALSKAKKPEEIIALYDRIELSDGKMTVNK